MRSLVFEIMRFTTIEQYKLMLWIRKIFNKSMY